MPSPASAGKGDRLRKAEPWSYDLLAPSSAWLCRHEGDALGGIRKVSCYVAALLFCVGLLAISSFASGWRMIGPDGGNVRSLAYDPSNPNHILLGTSSGQLFASHDGGNSWELFAHFRLGEDYVFDHIVFDPTNPATIYVAGWGLFNDTEGGVFRSDDGGKTWRELPGVHGKSIRALAMAPSDHNNLVIGALDGVFRSRDGGATWQRMTPENPEIMENHSSMKNFVSVAIDPQDPDVVYAGTRHLAWKTSDGGSSWRNVKDGMLDDSDVFSIIVDPKTPSRIYASACSGIYKSDNGAELFRRVQGLPHSAIRTRVLKQDPQRSSIVYAGTTRGLWKTLDGGVKWSLVTTSDVVVNDVMIDPRNPDRVLLATDLRGVLASNDAFAHYTTSNRGFSHRAVGAVLVDRKDPSRLYVGLTNDRDMGGVFIWDGGAGWRQSNRGLGERDILSLRQAESGVLFAGTNHGIFCLSSLSGSWQPATMISASVPERQANEASPEPATFKRNAGRGATARKQASRAEAKPAPEPVISPDSAPRVRSLELGKDAWFAATSEGLFISVDQGKKWYRQPVEAENNFTAVDSREDGTVTLFSYKVAYLSKNWGKSWDSITLPSYVSGIQSLTLVPDSSLWLGTRQGALHTRDGGETWQYAQDGLPMDDVIDVEYEPTSHCLLATALHRHEAFESKDGGRTWQPVPGADVPIRTMVTYQGHLLAVTAHNGVLLEDGEGASSRPQPKLP